MTSVYIVDLPISKSIANRLLVRSALRGDMFPELPASNLPEDVLLLYKILTDNQSSINVGNCGTAMRFLTAYYAQKEGKTVQIDGNERMRKRPIGTLVEALRKMGADIDYLGEDGYPPLCICGRKLHGVSLEIPHTESTQFISALLLIKDYIDGELQLKTDMTSPYIAMTEHILSSPSVSLERDWSSAAFWYEYVALHTDATILLKKLTKSTIQGDVVVSELFKSFGVNTSEVEDGILLSKNNQTQIKDTLTIDFSDCPDLYPAVYLTALRLGVKLHCLGTERLAYKESDRLTAFDNLTKDTGYHPSFHDHRIAMALLMADFETYDLACIAKSYPDFVKQWRECRRK